ncbi:MAG TPA: membrane protein insertase YidC, partial [Candidatus Baltobacteraceae bacterium]|nr:membrane protein insertase YidC [Candidatus Baltobacteraceae bacterium]
RYTFTSRGGGLKSVELLKYPETISARWRKQNESSANGVATLNARTSVPVLSILGDSSLIGDGNFTLTKTDGGVRAEKLLTDGLRLVKEFSISSNYLVNASVTLTNVSDKPLALPVQEWVVGTATPMGPDDTAFSIYGGALWFDGTKPQNCAASYFSAGLFHRIPRTEYSAGTGNVVWAAAHNQFFVLLAMPERPAQEIIAQPVILQPFTNIEQAANAPLPEGIQTALVYPAQTLAANSSVERRIVFFAGPKEYRTLARIGEEFNNRADLVMQFGFFGFFAKALLSVMNWVHDVTRLGYGWVIVLITVIIKMVFWPLTAASTRSMKKMQALGPEVKALKEKYKDDPQKFTQKQMELWKKNKVSPMSGCLPMLIQTPVFIGFYTMIRSAIELRGAHFLWVADLSKPDTLFMIPGLTFVPFISTPEGLPFNLLPLLMGGAMLWQSHLQPPSPGMDPGQAKMMRYMPLIFLLFLYNYSAGLALYWTVNNLLTIAQTKITKMNQAPAANTIPALTPLSKKKK